MSDATPLNSRNLKFVLHALFLVSGSTAVLIGQLLPILAQRYQLSDLQLSLYFPSQFAGSLAGTFLTSRFARKDRYLSASIAGSLLMALGIGLMNLDSFPVSLAAFAINGVGIGLTLPAINMTMLELNPLNSASALSILNFCWGIGAIICKPFVDFTSRGTNIVLTTAALAVPLVVFSGMLYYQPLRRLTATATTDEEVSADLPIWTLPIAWAIALFNFIHVGFEGGMGGWLTTYTGRLDASNVVHWFSPTLIYFALFVIGRGVAPLLFRIFSENKMLMLGLLTILAGMAFTVLAHSVEMLDVGAAVAGFGTSWIFPTNVSRFSKTFGAASTRRSTPLFICGTLGAASSTWLIGFVSDRTGNLRSGMYVLVVSVVLLIVLQAGLSIRTRHLLSLSSEVK